MRTYSELIKLPTFKERFDYLNLHGKIGDETFGKERYLNQMFYRSQEWRRLRNEIIARDLGCDLGVPGFDIKDGVMVVIHHMEPIILEEFLDDPRKYLDPEYLITVTDKTHRAIHYGDGSGIFTGFVERTPGDTKLWR